ncbi:MAG: hypothetical protein JXB29_00500, partial [Sedimentisphaerales bacterium]|nr:hypothetical protein [Sedimentisphaerales bacterium]
GKLTMEIPDYYCSTTITSTMGYTMGRAVGAVRVSTLLVATSVAVPFTVGVVVTGKTKVAWDCSFRRRFKCRPNPGV